MHQHNLKKGSAIISVSICFISQLLEQKWGKFNGPSPIYNIDVLQILWKKGLFYQPFNYSNQQKNLIKIYSKDFQVNFTGDTNDTEIFLVIANQNVSGYRGNFPLTSIPRVVFFWEERRGEEKKNP